MIASNGNTGRGILIKESNEQMPPIRAHFENLLTLHINNVRATKAVCEVTIKGSNNVSVKENDSGVAWLDSSTRPWSLYYHCDLSQGWLIKPKKK